MFLNNDQAFKLLVVLALNVCAHCFTTFSFKSNNIQRSFVSLSSSTSSTPSGTDADITSNYKFIGRTLYCNVVGFGVELINPCIKLNDKSEAVFFNGMESLQPGYWRVIENPDTNIATIEITQPLRPEYLLFFDIWEKSILWKGEISMKNYNNNDPSSLLQVTNGQVTTNKKKFGLFPYTDTIATYNATIYTKDEDLQPKLLKLPKFKQQQFLAPEDFDSPYDMKRYPQYFAPEYVEWFFSVEEAMAKGEEPPVRPKTFFLPDANSGGSNDSDSDGDSSNSGNNRGAKKGFNKAIVAKKE